MSTVIVKPLEDLSPHLLMAWSKVPQDTDVIEAFESIRKHIDRLNESVCIIVDVTENPNYNLRLTFTEALRIQKMLYPPCWLVVGQNHLSTYIARLLESMGQTHIEWFHSYEEALQFIQERTYH